MYVAVKGGEKAISAAHRWLADRRRGDRDVPEIEAAQVREQLTLAVDRVMAEGSLYDRDLAALAIKQARGDLLEAAFLIRAFRTTLPRFGATEPVDTAAMLIARRISATYKDLPGGQVLGPTFDYTHRLIDFLLEAGVEPPEAIEAPVDAAPESTPRVTDLLAHDDMIEPDPAPSREGEPFDLTREPLAFPADRETRLQSIARGDEGFLLSLGYSTQRGYGKSHPFAGEIRLGEVTVEFVPEDLGFAVPLGTIELTECQMVNQFKGSAVAPPRFTRGYGLAFGHAERKAMSMALVDRALRASELGEEVTAPAQDVEFVLMHADTIQATGFVEHLKLPHYVDFQAELGLIRQLKREFDDRQAQSLSPRADPLPAREAAE